MCFSVLVLCTDRVVAERFQSYGKFRHVLHVLSGRIMSVMVVSDLVGRETRVTCATTALRSSACEVALFV